LPRRSFSSWYKREKGHETVLAVRAGGYSTLTWTERKANVEGSVEEIERHLPLTFPERHIRRTLEQVQEGGWLPSREEVFDSAGTLLHEAVFADYEINQGLPDELFQPRSPSIP